MTKVERPSRRRLEGSTDTSLGGCWDLVFEATGEVVEDVEALARGVLGAERWPLYLPPADNEDLLAHLLEQSVVLSRVYARRSGIEARPFLFQRLVWRARDWRDAYERRLRRELPSDLGREDALVDAGGEDGGGSGGAGRGDNLADDRSSEDSSDRRDSGLDALRGLLERGDRTLLREIKALGLGSPPGAPDVARAGARVDPFLDCRGCGWRHFAEPPNGEPGWHYPRSCRSCGVILERGWVDEAAA